MTAPFNWNFTETGSVAPERKASENADRRTPKPEWPSQGFSTPNSGGWPVEHLDAMPAAEQRAREAEGLSATEQREEELRKLLGEAEARQMAGLNHIFYADAPEDRIATIRSLTQFNTIVLVVNCAMTAAIFVALVATVILFGW